MQNPKPSNEDEIERTETVLAQPQHLSRFPQSALNQGAIEQILEDKITSEGKIRVERNTIPVELRLEETEACSDDQEAEQGSYPIHVTLRNIGEDGRASTPAGTKRHLNRDLKFIIKLTFLKFQRHLAMRS